MPRHRPDPAWKTVLWLAPASAVLFIVLGGIGTGYTPRAVLFLGLAGLTIGALMVPEVDPEAVRYPTLWQMVSGAIGGILIAAGAEATRDGYLAGALIGMALGFLAPYWLKYVNV